VTCHHWNANGPGSLCCNEDNPGPECHTAVCPLLPALRGEIGKWREVADKLQDQYEELHAKLECALLREKTLIKLLKDQGRLDNGRLCWCQKSLDNPMFKKHTEACDVILAMISEAERNG